MSEELPPVEAGPVSEGEVPPPPLPPPRGPERFPFWGYAEVFLIAGLSIPCMFVGWGLVKLVMLLFHLHVASPAEEAVPEMLIGYGLLFGALATLFRIQYERPFWQSLGWIPARIGFLWNVILGLGTALLVALVGRLMQTPPTKGPIVEMMKGPGALVLVAIFGTTVAPLCEELVFRGFVQPVLVRQMGAVAGILMTSVIFGGLHYSEYGQSWRLAVQIGISGVAFGWVRQVTGSTRASTVMHAAFNALSFVSLFAQHAK